MSDAIYPVPQTPSQIGGLPPLIDAILVLNSGHVDVVVNNVPVTLTPQSGCRLAPGRLVEFPRAGIAMQLFGVADGAVGQVTVVIFPHGDGDGDGDDD